MAVDQANLLPHDIHLPAPAHWWPPAIGWWILAIVLLALLLVLLFIGLRWLRYIIWRRRLLRTFRTDCRQLDKAPDTELLNGVNSLLKRLAIKLYPHADTAGLSGYPWLAFLKQQAPQQLFTDTVDELLAESGYRPATDALSAGQRQMLLDMALQWARHNLDRDNFNRLRREQRL